MTAHDHREFTPGCFRCDLSREESTHGITFPEVREMTHEEGAQFYVLHEAPTKPEACTCRHEGLGMGWHLGDCPVKGVLLNLRSVLA